MLECTFELNGKAMSALRCGALAFPAFSGLDHHKNRPEFSCYASTGPIPRGTYYVVDRQSGGMLGSIRDSLRNKNEWFALYAVDGKIDDEAFCNAIRRGEFRLHPKGGQGISKGALPSRATWATTTYARSSKPSDNTPCRGRRSRRMAG
ncbi:hypothetical protein D3C81_1326410 [compost metagenome]